MTNSNPTRRTVLKAVAASAGAVALPRALFAQSGDTLRIGACVPITGPFAMSGQQYHYSLQMAQDDINKAGGIKGRKLEIVFEDVQASNSVAVNAYIKLVRDLNPPFVFLSSYSTQNLATEPEVRKSQIPCMYAGGAEAVHERGNPWMFRIRPADSIQATAMAQYALKDMGKKKPGILFIQNDFGQGAASNAERIFKDAGISVAGSEAYGVNDNDMSAQLLKLKNAGADVILEIGYPKDGALIMKQLKSLGIGVPMIISSGLVVPAAISLLTPEETADIVGVTDAFLDPSRGPKVADYVERFQKRFNLRPDPYGSCFYDGAMILKSAIEAAGTDKAKLRDYLKGVKNHEGVTQVFNTDAHGNMAHSVAVVKFKPGTTELAYVKTITV